MEKGSIVGAVCYILLDYFIETTLKECMLHLSSKVHCKPFALPHNVPSRKVSNFASIRNLWWLKTGDNKYGKHSSISLVYIHLNFFSEKVFIETYVENLFLKLCFSKSKVLKLPCFLLGIQLHIVFISFSILTSKSRLVSSERLLSESTLF